MTNFQKNAEIILTQSKQKLEFQLQWYPMDQVVMKSLKENKKVNSEMINTLN